MIKTKPRLPRLPTIRLDWRAYFLRFSAIHGGDPVPYKGRLLYRDGWMYSATDYQGPEYPPLGLATGVRDLVRRYWQIRLATVNRERRDLAEQLEGLIETQASRSAPLQQAVVVRGDEGKREWRRGDLDLDVVRERLDLLRCIAEECQKELGIAKATSNGRHARNLVASINP